MTDCTRVARPSADLRLDLAFRDATRNDSIFSSNFVEIVFPQTMEGGKMRFDGFWIKSVSNVSPS
jgi:hypothetical protein